MSKPFNYIWVIVRLTKYTEALIIATENLALYKFQKTKITICMDLTY